MEQLGKDIEKIIKAGIGAVSTGVEKSAVAIEKLAQKGEPLFNQAKSTVCEAAGKLKKAVDDSNIPENISMLFGGKVTVETLISALRQFSKEELDLVKAAIDDMYESASEKAKVCGCQQPENDADAQTQCCPCCTCDEPQNDPQETEEPAGESADVQE